MAGIDQTPAAQVVITGIGLCTPLGPDRTTTWRRLLDGHSGLDWIDPAHTIAGGRALLAGGSAAGRRVGQLAEQVADEAWRDSRLSLDTVDPLRLGCVFGTSKGELEDLLHQGVRQETWLGHWPSAAANRLAQRFSCCGAVLAPVAACATGLAACIRAAELISSGTCDVVLAGSADASLFPAVIGSFQRLGVLAKLTDDPRSACRPFDRRRDGFLIGEGAACLVMERRSRALARGARSYGVWCGGRLGSDPSGLTRCDTSGLALSHVLRQVLALCPDRPDYINLHGTATTMNDIAECQAVRRTLGPAAVRVACSGLKGSLGHLLGAAGSVELALTLLALRDQVIPPTLNLTEPDPECDLNLTPRTPRPLPVRTAIKISSGFGGHLAVAAVGRCD